MGLLDKTGIQDGSLIRPEHITRIYDALNGEGDYEINATGSLSGSFRGTINATGSLSGSFIGSINATGSFSGSVNASRLNVNGITTITGSTSITGSTTLVGSATITGSTTTDLVRITQTGTGNAFVVEDSTNPDATPFVIDASGSVAVGSTGSYKPYSQYGDLTTIPKLDVFASGSIPLTIRTTNQNSDHVLFTSMDTNTKWWMALSGDDFRIYNTASAENILLGVDGSSVNTGNKVGIGIALPTARLSVSGNMDLTSSATTTINIQSGAGVRTYLAADGQGASFGSVSNHDVVLYRNNSEFARMTSTGFGLGTSTPANALHIQGDDKSVVASQTGYPWGSNGVIGVAMGNAFPYQAGVIDFRRFAGVAASHSVAVITQENVGGTWGLAFKTNVTASNSIASSTRMYISTAGAVGIGTTNPGANLEVYNDTEATSWIKSAGNSYLRLKRGSITADAHISFDTVNDQKHIIGLINTTDSLIVGGTEATPVITISGSNVGIGNTNPNVALDVTGEIAIRGTEGADDARMYFRAADNSNRFTIETDLDPSNTLDKLGFRSTFADNILVLGGNGNVGIGTVSPTASLHIKPPLPATSGQSGIVIESNAGTGINLISDNYNTHQSVVTFGRQQSSMAAFLAYGVNATRSLDSAYQSSQDAFANRPTVLELGNGFFALKYNTSSLNRPYGTNVPMSTALFMDSAGRMGMGTTTPQGILHISSSGYNEPYPLIVGFNQFVVSGSGNVGIGTTAPINGLLHVAGNIFAAGAITSSGMNIVGTTTFASSSWFNGNTTNDLIKITQAGTGNAFLVEDESGDGSPFVINSAGLVGIGKTSPSTTLDVNGNAIITGSLTVTNNFTVLGSSSIQHISSSQLNIGDNIITVNTMTPAIKFGGIAVIDSGSIPQRSGSLLFNSDRDEWIFVHQNTAGTVTSSALLMGPQTYNAVGSETYPTTNRIMKSLNAEHVGDSNISDTGTVVAINSNTDVTGSVNITNGQAYKQGGDTVIYLSQGTDTYNTNTIGGMQAGTSGLERQTAYGFQSGINSNGSFLTSVGFQAGYFNSGSNQTAVGIYAGYLNSGSETTAIGSNAGVRNIGRNLTAVGFQAGWRNTGSNNTAMGVNAGYQNTGSNNTNIGVDAGFKNSGSSNTSVGYQSGYQNTASNQTAVGMYAGYQNSGYAQTAIGRDAGFQNSADNQTVIGIQAGTYNDAANQTAMGYGAGYQNTGSGQTAVGMYAGYQNTGSNQSAFGYNAGYLNSGSGQTAIGVNAGYVNSGSSQTAIGHGAGYQNSGTSQTAVGYEAGTDNEGSQQTALGLRAGKQNSGANQTAVGYFAGFLNSGSDNTNIGFEAGIYTTSTTPNTQSTQSVFIGSSTKAGGAARTNQIVIGYGATGIGSNSVVLGNDSITTTVLKGNVGIGITGSAAKLHLYHNTYQILTIERSGSFNAPIQYTNAVNTIYTGVSSNGSFVIGTNPDLTNSTGAHLTISGSSGAVGIGTTNPIYRLDVYNTGSQDAVRLYAASTSSFNRIIYEKPLQKWSAGMINTNAFAIADETTGQYRLQILSSSADWLINSNGTGSVGIGLMGGNSPSAKLHVNNNGSGNAFLVEDSNNPDATPFVIDTSGNVSIGTTGSSGIVTMRGVGANGVTLDTDGTAGTDHQSTRLFFKISGSGNDIAMRNLSGSLLFATQATANGSSGTPRMTISSSGTVFVPGNVQATSFTGSLQGTASFAGTASYVINAGISSSYAVTSSFASRAAFASSASITNTPTDNVNYYITFVEEPSGNEPIRVDSNILTYNPSTNIMTTTASFAVTASRAVTASYAVTATNASNAVTATNASNVAGWIQQSYSTSTYTMNSWNTAAFIPVSPTEYFPQSLALKAKVVLTNGDIRFDGTTDALPIMVEYNAVASMRVGMNDATSVGAIHFNSSSLPAINSPSASLSVRLVPDTTPFPNGFNLQFYTTNGGGDIGSVRIDTSLQYQTYQVGGLYGN